MVSANKREWRGRQREAGWSLVMLISILAVYQSIEGVSKWRSMREGRSDLFHSSWSVCLR